MKTLFTDKNDEVDGDVDIADQRQAMITTINIPKSFQYCKFLTRYEEAWNLVSQCIKILKQKKMVKGVNKDTRSRSKTFFTSKDIETYTHPAITFLKLTINTRARCKICLNDVLRHSTVFIVNFEHISHLFLVFLLSTLSR